LNLPKEELHRNIYARVDKMLADGLVEEVNALRSFRHLNALKTVGYAEIFQYLDGEITLAKAAELIKINTRQYAKRQLTWFKKDPEMQWFSPYEYESIVKVIKERLVLPHSTQ
jgi:tRNA dimethylallyltransferase